jgi:hypothetical protein
MAGNDRFPDVTLHGRCVVQGEEAEEVRRKRDGVAMHVAILCFLPSLLIVLTCLEWMSKVKI